MIKGRASFLSDRNLDNGVFLRVTFRMTREFVCRRQSSMFGHRSCSAEICGVVFLGPRGTRPKRILTERWCGPCDQVLALGVGAWKTTPRKKTAV